MEQGNEDILRFINESFQTTISHEFRENKIWWTEADLVGAFYHIFRPQIDKIPNFEICLEWEMKVKTKKGGRGPRIDLMVVKKKYSKSGSLIEAIPHIAIEFKWGDKRNQPENARGRRGHLFRARNSRPTPRADQAAR